MCSTTHGLLGLFLGLVLASRSRSLSRGLLCSLAVGLGLGDLSWRSLVAATTSSALLGTLLTLLLLLVFGRFGRLDDDSTAIEFLLVELGDSFFDGSYF